MKPQTPYQRTRKYLKKRKKAFRRALRFARGRVTYRFREADITIFQDFKPPPAGGGIQFLRGLWTEFERCGLRVENNIFSHTTRACVFNSYNFDFNRLRRWRHAGFTMIHRVDGPLMVYRGFDDGTDSRIQKINEELADVTVFQSEYSLRKSEELGLSFQSPHIIMNAVDPQIFHSHGRTAFDRSRKIRLISSSWSDNPHKGAAIYKWLEEHLNWGRFEYTFVGNSPVAFDRIQMRNPVPSERLAEILRHHDIYITASQHEACSNSVLEALSCGLPVIYLESGSNAELVTDAGYGFGSQEEIPELLNTLVEEYESRQANIAIPSLAGAAQQYLALMGFPTTPQQ